MKTQHAFIIEYQKGCFQARLYYFGQKEDDIALHIFLENLS
jgi:hypothetical protein